jgi:hypothetical protein
VRLLLSRPTARVRLTPSQDQKATLLRLTEVIPVLRRSLESEVVAIDRACQEAKVEENDYTVLTVDDLAYELELTEAGIRKKIAFVENQVSARNHHSPLALAAGLVSQPIPRRSALTVEPELTSRQMVSATHTNLTPAKLEEFEATFKHFDKDDTNVRTCAHHCLCQSVAIITADGLASADTHVVGDELCSRQLGHCVCSESESLLRRPVSALRGSR